MGGSEKKVLTARSSPKRLSSECVISVVASNQTPPYFRSSASPRLGHVACAITKEHGSNKEMQTGTARLQVPLGRASDCIRLVLNREEIKSLR